MNLSRISFLFFTLVFSLFQTSSLLAIECKAESSKSRVALLELYTSEGCSSCPPADKWLGKLSQQGIGLDKLVPLSLHVDYWNYIGWKDPYSAAEYTQRQRQIAQRNRLRSIYTPQMVFNGRDYRGWRRQSINELVNEVNGSPAMAKIAFNWQTITNNVFSASITSELINNKIPSSTLYVALYENNLVSNVTAGENDGRSLKHNYVVRKMFAIPFSDKRKISKVIDIELKQDWNKANLGLAVFVQQHSDGGVLQALASPLKCKT